MPLPSVIISSVYLFRHYIFLARLKGVEPLSEVLETPILPLNYRRIYWWSFSYHLEDTLCSQAVRQGFHLLCLYSKAYPLLGSEGEARTHDILINSQAQLPTVLPRNIYQHFYFSILTRRQ